MQHKAKKFAAIFLIPRSQQLYIDEKCQMQAEMLLSGKLYVFSHFLCFRATFFSAATNTVIPLSDVVTVSSSSKEPSFTVLTATKTLTFTFKKEQKRNAAVVAVKTAWLHARENPIEHKIELEDTTLPAGGYCNHKFLYP